MSLKRVSTDHCFYGLIHIDLTSIGEEKLCSVFQLFADPMGWGTHPFKPTGYRIDDGKRMTIFESKSKGHFAEQKPFPFDPNPENALAIIEPAWILVGK